MAERLQAGQRVRLGVDTLGFHSGDTGRVLHQDRVPGSQGEAVLYWCEMADPEGTRLGAFYPDEIEALT